MRNYALSPAPRTAPVFSLRPVSLGANVLQAGQAHCAIEDCVLLSVSNMGTVRTELAYVNLAGVESIVL